MVSIMDTFLYIGNISNVIRSKNILVGKLLKVNKRHSDAFVYILFGSCRYTFNDGKSFIAKEGDVIYLAKDSVYKMIAQEEYGFIFCDFAFVSDRQQTSELFTPKEQIIIKQKFQKLLTVFNSVKNGNYCPSLSLLYEIYNNLILSTEASYNAKSIKQKILYAKNYIDANLKDCSLSVETLAEQAEVSPVYFRKKFREIFSISPSQYITSSRMENAKKLMQLDFLSLSETARLSGFSSVQYFCRVFKKETGLTPLKYRNKNL